MEKRFNPTAVENKWYSHWEKQGYFHSEPDEREAFSIVIPPPNVTGVLHMGHMLNNTIQDILIRKARMDGYNACWVPGTDHASIATEAKVVRSLREEGIKKSDLSRDEFLEYAWKWKEKYGGIILEQLRKLGASCDWERTAFTMDEVRSEAVMKVFVDLYKKGKLYRKKRMVNWDPDAKTVLSNEEVLYENEYSKLYYLSYPIEGSNGESLTIATTRPETILGDTAVAVHPDDERFQHLKGKNVIVPLIDRSIPVIFDDYVDIEFGTGALKITPAHDPNDYDIGLKHDLEIIDILNPNGTLNEQAQLYVGEDRFVARKNIVVELEEKSYLQKIEDYTHNVGRSERTNAVVEPRLSLQWYVDMKALAAKALDAVETDEVDFIPKKQKNIYRHWMQNIRDWCISRQLWWGHRIPAYYVGEEVFVAETIEEALEQARKALGNPLLQLDDLRQDEDVLDTWFSSWLWPISVFDGFNNKEELDYYYPTSVLVTGWDIIFLWVARMIMAGYEWKNERPFEQVFFTGMVRDKKRRKMSKSLGNSPDALKLIDDFGADGVRFGMMTCSNAGNDLLFDEKLCEQGRNFCNKIWNALRLIKSWEVDDNKNESAANQLASEWFENRLNQVLAHLEKEFDSYRLSDAMMELYSLVWGDFCSWYLEMIKPEYGGKIDAKTKGNAISFFEKLTLMLHPFMPFITEEVWHLLKDRNNGVDCMISAYPASSEYDRELINDIEQAKNLISKIRDVRAKQGISKKDELEVYIEHTNVSDHLLANDSWSALVKNLANLSKLEDTETDLPGAVTFMSDNNKFYVVMEKSLDLDAERDRLNKELEYARGFIVSVEKKLSNERFVQNAPEIVVEKERKKLADGKERIRILEESLSRLD